MAHSIFRRYFADMGSDFDMKNREIETLSNVSLEV